VLEREPHAEIRRQAKRRDHLGSTDLVPARRGLAWHVPTVLQLDPAVGAVRSSFGELSYCRRLLH